MKAFILAFLALAAVAVSADEVSENPVMTKSQYLEILRRKLGVTKGLQKRELEDDIENCKVRECASAYHYCDIENYTCRGFSGCVNNTCIYSKAGDLCNLTIGIGCYHPNLYCDVDRCREYAVPGTICRNQRDCESLEYDLYCNVLDYDERPLGFCKLDETVTKKAGEECDYTEQHLYREYCESGSYCDADEVKRKGVCKALPRNVNEPCEMEHGCYGLYCFEGNETCQPFPKAGQMCVNRKCADGLYCDGTFCRQLKDINETCRYYGSQECLPDLSCLKSKAHNGKYVCTYYYLLEGDYCIENYMYYEPRCSYPLACINNTCTREDHECESDSDCPDFTYGCNKDHKCVGGMNVGEDEECVDVSDRFNSSHEFHIRSTLQCKPGLVCVPNITGEEGHVCKKAHSKKGDLNFCNGNEDCPYDSVCKCDDSIGLSICAPIPSSSKKLKEVYEKFLYGGDDEELNLYEYLIDNYLYYSSEFRCDKYLTYHNSGASMLKASVAMTAIFALFAFLF